MKVYSVSLIALSLVGCKSLGMDSLVHPHVTNHISFSLSEEVHRAIVDEKNKEQKRLRQIHDFEEKTLHEKHEKLEKEIAGIHKNAERVSNEQFLSLEEKIMSIIAVLTQSKRRDDGYAPVE